MIIPVEYMIPFTGAAAFMSRSRKKGSTYSVLGRGRRPVAPVACRSLSRVLWIASPSHLNNSMGLLSSSLHCSRKKKKCCQLVCSSRLKALFLFVTLLHEVRELGSRWKGYAISRSISGTMDFYSFINDVYQSRKKLWSQRRGLVLRLRIRAWVPRFRVDGQTGSWIDRQLAGPLPRLRPSPSPRHTVAVGPRDPCQ